jgi:epoxyqueuosine reductase QueG
MPDFKSQPEKAIISEILKFTAESPANQKPKTNTTPYFETPVVGFADVGDSMFMDFKSIIGEFHCAPLEILKQCFPGNDNNWRGASVISWALPISGATRKSNRQQDRYPSRAWAHTRAYGEEFNNELREHIVLFLNKQGVKAVAPAMSPFFEVLNSEKNGFCSNWSERHIAYVAGLGTFGLSRALITEKGAAVRCGSVVADIKLKPTMRRYKEHNEYCLFYSSGECGVCIKRCPGGAITTKGHNKDLCMMHCSEVMEKSEEYDAAMPGCGLCQTGVPCEFRIPGQKKDQ